MSDPSLLAASLLTQGKISDAVTVKLPLIQQAATTDETIVSQKILPTIEITSPEFSQQRRQEIPSLQTHRLKPTVSEPAITKAVIPRKFNTLPASGSQMYSQRLAALRAGKVYTRVPSNSFQSAWVKATEQPTYEQWKQLLAKEAKAIATGQGSNQLTILVGDSLSLWFPSDRLPGDRLWLNQGISGDTSAGILKRLSAFSRTRPDAIYLMVGINDLRRGATNESILRNHRQILRRLRFNHPQARIIVQSILPTRKAGLFNDRILQINQQLAAIAYQEGATYLNLFGLFSDAEGNLRSDLTTDGLHLSPRGYEVWQYALQQTNTWVALNRHTDLQKGLKR
jgi:lysophospholipase L1-like esterase